MFIDIVDYNVCCFIGSYVDEEFLWRPMLLIRWFRDNLYEVVYGVYTVFRGSV